MRDTVGVRLMATDLDGTLLGPAGAISARNLASLRKLGDQGVVRVIATGRSGFSALKVLPRDLPIDYLIVSSGAGVIDWKTRTYLRTIDMEPSQSADAAEALCSMGLDFMVHDPMPDNHRFVFHRAVGCADFERRVALYDGHAVSGAGPWAQKASQLLAVHGPDSVHVEAVAASLPTHTVLRTTSPLDHASVWIEIFPAAVSKAQGCAWVAARHGLSAADAVAVGNDTNDLDMLRWAHRGVVVRNAHPSLLTEFEAVSAYDHDGFSDAAALEPMRA